MNKFLALITLLLSFTSLNTFSSTHINEIIITKVTHQNREFIKITNNNDQKIVITKYRQGTNVLHQTVDLNRYLELRQIILEFILKEKKQPVASSTKKCGDHYYKLELTGETNIIRCISREKDPFLIFYFELHRVIYR